jgi:hypothetical protein
MPGNLLNKALQSGFGAMLTKVLLNAQVGFGSIAEDPTMSAARRLYP